MKTMRKMKLKTFRVHFEISGNSYRDVEAFDEQDAREQVEHDSIFEDDLDRAMMTSITVDDVELLKKKRKVRK